MSEVGLADIELARERLANVARHTPLHPFAKADGTPAFWLKCESLQLTGSFKIRGAYNAVAGLPQEERGRGVITYSSGNHGQAVACASQLLGVKAVIVMPEDAIPLKVERTRQWGAEVVFAGHTSPDREERAMELVREHGYVVIPPFDDRRIVAGQGTCGLEIVEQHPDIETVVVPVGGGGLISGVATAVTAMKPAARVVGVEPESAADGRDSLRIGTLQTWSRVDTIADGLRTSRLGDLNFEIIRRCVDDIVTVSDEEILEAMTRLAIEAKLVAEPSGAATTAAVLGGYVKGGERAVAVVSGGNVAPDRLGSELSRLSTGEPASLLA